MKVLVAKIKSSNSLKYYNGKHFVQGQSRALDISNQSDEHIQNVIKILYNHLEKINQTGTVEYFTMEIAEKKEWKPILECNDDDDNPTCWALEINHNKYGKYVWISGVLDTNEKNVIEYNVEISKLYDKDLDEMKVLVKCKSLSSAKRWVTKNLL